MRNFHVSHLADHVLLREFVVLVNQDRATTARLLAYLAEVDHRKIYLPAAHDSMFAYCVRELHMSEDTAYRRIGVARTARQFPAIFPALAEGRLNLTAVLLLTPHLTPENADELLAAVVHKSKSEIECLLAERFPRPDAPTLVRAIASSGTRDEQPMQRLEAGTSELALERVVPLDQAGNADPMVPLAQRPKVTPLSPGRYELRVTVSEHAHEQLRYAQALLGHALPSGDIAQVLERALDVLVEKLEKQKFAKGSRSAARAGRGGDKPKGRYIPAAIRRAVRERDGGQCTFVSDRGKRCESRRQLEYDHVEPVARGGETTVAGLRLRCRAHNQYEAERTFGAAFVAGKRERSQRRAVQAKQQVEQGIPKATEQLDQKPARSASPNPHRSAADVSDDRDVTPWLRALGFTSQEARRGAELCANLGEATLEQRVRIALRGLAPRCVHHPAPVISSAT